MRTLLFLLAACVEEKEPEEKEPVDTGSIDTADTAPPEETGDSAPPEETGDSAPDTDTEIDNDLDGVSLEDGDCDDTDPLIYPGATDVACDQVDANCDGVGESDMFLIGETLYDSLALALTSAVDGDTIDVCPGLYVENNTISTPITLTIRGYGGTSADTELDGGSLGPVLALAPGVDLTLEDIALVNGVAIWQDTGVVSGGGIYANEAKLTLTRTRFENNTAQDDGGAIALLLGDDTTGLVVTDGEFIDNRASINGGAIAVFGTADTEITIDGTSFTENRAPQLGGAVYLEGDPLTLVVSNATFTTNSTSGARAYGGAIASSGDEVNVIATDTTFTGNTSGNSAGAISLGADRSTLELDTCTFSANTATQTGGAIRVSSDNMDIDLVAVTFDANLSSTNAGAVQLDGSGTAQFDTVTVSDNSAGNAGGGYYFDESDGGTLQVLIASGLINTNRAGIGGGGGIYATGAYVEVADVDLGSGSSVTNTPEDVYMCSTDFGAAASFVFDDSSGTLCQ